MTAVVATRAWRETLGRSALYAFLARSLAYPSAAHRDAIARELVPILRGARTADDAVASALAAALDASVAPASELLAAFRGLFPAVGQGEIPVYESAYRTRDVFQESEILADVAGFYRAHGLVAGAAERERPDHIAVELEFMAFLARKRAHALAELGPSEAGACRAAERLFLREHLGAWAPLLGARLAQLARHPAYATLGTLLERWTLRERPAGTLPLGPAPRERAEEPADDGCPLEVLA